MSQTSPKADAAQMASETLPHETLPDEAIWREYRGHFPAADQFVYLNAAGGGPIPTQAADAARRYYDQSESSGDMHWADWIATVEDCRGRVAALLNVHADEIAFVQNASAALNHVTSMLAPSATHMLCPMDEFPSLPLPWRNQGVPVTLLSVGIEGSDAGHIAQPGHNDLPLGAKKADIVASLVQYRSGILLNRGDLAALRKSGARSLTLDLTQCFGTIPLDLPAISADAAAISLYKWIGAGYGAGILYLKSGMLKSYGYPAVGWRSAEAPYDMISDRLTVTHQARDLELGHPPIPAVLALHGALELMEGYGFDAIAGRIASLSHYLANGLEALGLAPRPNRAEARAGILTIELPDPKSVVARLKAEGILVSAHGGYLRISVNAYNSARDIDQLLTWLKQNLST